MQIHFMAKIKHFSALYRCAAKSAKAFFSDLTVKNHCTPKVLFSVIHSVVNPCSMPFASDALCESFLKHFSNKISILRPKLIKISHSH